MGKLRGFSPDRRRTATDAALTLLFVAVMLLTLFAGGEIGLSDNFDFWRVLNAGSLHELRERTAFLYNGAYGIRLEGGSLAGKLLHVLFNGDGLDEYPNIQIVPVRLTAAANLLWNTLRGGDPALFRLRTLGVLYTLLYGAALFALFRQIRMERFAAELASKVLAGLVLCDVGYVAYFDSFYSEPLQIIGLVLCAAFGLGLLREREDATPSPGLRAGFLLSAGLYGGAKFANIPVGLLFIAAFALAFRRQLLKHWLVPVSGAAAALFLTVSFLLIPSWMDGDTNFNAVFYGVVRNVDAETAEEYIADLGLDPGMAQYAGNHAYVEGVREAFAAGGYEARFQAAVSKTSLLRFYLTHPGYFAQKLNFSLESAGLIRPYYLSNYGPDHPRLTLSQRFSLWGQLRLWLGTDTVLGNLALLLGSLALLALRLWRRDRLRCIAFCAAVAGAWCYHLMIPELTNGDADIAKHMFALVQLADLMLLAILLEGIAALARWKPDPRPVILGLVALCLLASPAGDALRWARLERGNGPALGEGSYLRLGTDTDGAPLTWLVAETGADGAATLLCAAPLAEPRAFSADNVNLWTESGLRVWLNGAFIAAAFTPEERALLRQREHPALLSVADKELAERGTLDFMCNHLQKHVAEGYADSYQLDAADTVALPDAPLIAALAGKGYRLAAGEAYWLMTPYFNNGNMVRCLYPDGLVSFQDAAEPRGVRPTVYLDLAAAAPLISGGSGALNDPFILRPGP